MKNPFVGLSIPLIIAGVIGIFGFGLPVFGSIIIGEIIFDGVPISVYMIWFACSVVLLLIGFEIDSF